MTLGGIETPQFHQPPISNLQDRRHVTAVRSSAETTDKSKEQPQLNTQQSVQDKVTLSQEAQDLAATTKGNSFQESPSPFDK